MNCPHDNQTECAGPANGERLWVCPVHGAKLTPTWTRLCREERRYRQVWLDGCGPGQIVTTEPSGPPNTRNRSGPGTELKELIAAWQRRLPWFDLSPRKGCGCADTARMMDRWGPDRCERQMNKILDKLEVEAKKRKLTVPFRRSIAKKLVKQAIRRARKK